jgi:hypothetical protein
VQVDRFLDSWIDWTIELDPTAAGPRNPHEPTFNSPITSSTKASRGQDDPSHLVPDMSVPARLIICWRFENQWT